MRLSMKTFAQKFTVVLLRGLSHLPLWFIYAVSDFLYYLIYYVIGYRKKVVFKNLKNSFPEKSDEERTIIAKKYYRHFCDLTLETIKLHGSSLETMNKRVKYLNMDRFKPYYDKGQGVILLSFHYNNWEWNTPMKQHLDHKLLMVYSPMKGNPTMERYMTDNRKRYGGVELPMQNAPRAALSLNAGKDSAIMWLAADQTPPATSQYWTTFLNQETPFFAGPQKIASKTKAPVFFHYIHKVGRGKYIADYFEISPSREGEGEYSILLDYIDIVEYLIQRQPEYWLWSHRRWKHTRQPDQPVIARNPQSRFSAQLDEMIANIEKQAKF